ASKLPSAELVDLRDLRSSDLRDLLAEEIAVWRETLDWDFHASAELVERFTDQRALSGYALVDRGKVFGYSYYVQDEHKGLVGNIYVRRSWRTLEAERQFLSALVEALMRTPFVTRIETQLMTLSAGNETMPGSRFLHAYDRSFMRVNLLRAPSLPPAATASG